MAPTALITGTSSGVGRQTVSTFRDAGWNVAATLRDSSRWSGEQSDNLLVLDVDVRDDNAVASGVTATVEHFGGLDVVVNNAGMGLFSVFESTPAEVIQDLFDTNVFGPMRVIRATLPVFHRQGSGRIVNITSSSAVLPTPLQAAYGATKAALHNFSEALGYELAHQGVEVKVVEPGFIPTTGFTAQTRERFGELTSPRAYQPYVAHVAASFETVTPQGHFASEQDVAAAVLEAATDTTGQSRFRVGHDAQDAAQQRCRPDADVDAWRRSLFAFD
jgi:NAD(P)-dependent dehydrogenase (short-subunit alcohol dehydrogenase family)